MQLGANMKRLREMDVADTVKARVTAGPGDLMTYEVSACLEVEGIHLQVRGQGPDLEMAAASAISVLSANGSALESQAGGDPLPAGGDSDI